MVWSPQRSGFFNYYVFPAFFWKQDWHVYSLKPFQRRSVLLLQDTGVQKSSIWMKTIFGKVEVNRSQYFPAVGQRGWCGGYPPVVPHSTLPHLTFSVPTGEVAEITATVTSLWEERGGQMERRGGRKQPTVSAQIILAPEAIWQVTAAHFSGLRVRWGD